jgi:hypothetical protein
MIKISLVGLVLLLTSACQIFKFKDVVEGRLQGEVVLVWVGGDDFVFVPGRNSIHYTTSDHIFIKPDEMFYTDGGSIPKIIRSLDGFSPWGFTPAYVIHDWLFTLSSCSPEKIKKIGIDFTQSAIILSEMIKTLMFEGKAKENENVFSAISWGVTTSFAREAWVHPKKCAVSKEDRALVQAALAWEKSEKLPKVGGLLSFQSLEAPHGQARVAFRRTY